MFGLGKKKNDITARSGDEVYLSIDIGTENIKTAVFRKKKRTIEILGYSRVGQRPMAMNKAIIMDSAEVLDTLDEGIGAAIHDAEKRFDDIALPKSAVIGIAGELVSGVPIVVSVDRNKPEQKVTQQEVQNVVKKVKEYAFSSVQQDVAAQLGLQNQQLEEIDTVIDSIKVDGIAVSSPIGLTGHELTYRVFSSFAPRVQIDSLELIAKQLKLDVEAIVVEPYALADALSGDQEMKDAIFIDVGSGTTDIAIVKDGDMQGIKMFAIGGRVFTKRIQSMFDISYVEAEELKLKYSNNSIDEYQKKEIKKGIKSDIDSWLLGVELALEEFEEVSSYPTNIYICGGGALLPDIMEGLLEYGWIQVLEFSKHPKVSFVFPNKIQNVQDLTRSINEPMDVTPLTLSRVLLKE